MSAIDFDEYKRLKILAAILPAALKRGMAFPAIEDLANRGLNDGSFLIGTTGELLGLPPSDFVDQWSQKPEAAHLFQNTDAADKSEGETVCGMPREKFDKLKPEQKLALANKMQSEGKRRGSK